MLATVGYPGVSFLRRWPNYYGKKNSHSAFAPDPVLSVSGHVADMLIGEIKEGKAELNRNARSPNVLRTVLARLGFCLIKHVDAVV